jgi:hypothetical protein
MPSKGNPRPSFRGGGPQRFTLKEMEEALRRGAGLPVPAAGILTATLGRHCTPQTVRNYLKRYPSLREAVAQQIENNLDTAEAKLLSAMNNGQDWAIKFYLETQGKHRGYSRRQEIAGVPGQPIQVTDAREWIVAQLDEMESRLRLESGGAGGPAAASGPAEAPQKTLH